MIDTSLKLILTFENIIGKGIPKKIVSYFDTTFLDVKVNKKKTKILLLKLESTYHAMVIKRHIFVPNILNSYYIINTKTC